MRERFGDEEWATLRLLPINGCILVAQALAKRKKVEKKRVDQLWQRVYQPGDYADPLHQELAKDRTAPDPESLLAHASSLGSAEIDTARDVLRKKLTPAESTSVNSVKLPMPIIISMSGYRRRTSA